MASDDPLSVDPDGLSSADHDVAPQQVHDGHPGASGVATPDKPKSGRWWNGMSARLSGGTVVLVMTLSVVAVTAGMAIILSQDAKERAQAQQARQDRAAVLAASIRSDWELFTNVRLAAAGGNAESARAEERVAATEVVKRWREVAAAAPNAGPENLAALDRLVSELESAVVQLGEGVSPRDLVGHYEPIAAAGKTVQDAQAAWQAEQDRLAQESARAEAARQNPGSRAPRDRATVDRRGGSPAAPEAPAPAPAPANPGSSWAAGVQSYGGGGLAAVINQRRADAGLNALGVSGSTSLQNHAAEMAAAGRIWHSGNDHIVGWVNPVSDTYMINAYMDSPSHKAWILREGVSTVTIGAVTYDGRLYTAMVFS